MRAPRFFRPVAGALCLIGLTCANIGPVMAQIYPGRMGGWRDGQSGPGRAEPRKDVAVETFRAADAGDALGKGRIVMTTLPLDDGEEPDPKSPVYEAAVIDQLAHRGYDVATVSDPGQIIQISIRHILVVPEEPPHKTVSGEVSTTVSNRGSGFGMALGIDLTKPAKAIVATRLDVRIRDKATNRVLWEGHADAEAREEEGGLDNSAVAARLAKALFHRFPEGKVVRPINQ